MYVFKYDTLSSYIAQTRIQLRLLFKQIFTWELEQQCHKLANQQTSITQQQIESFNVEQIAYILNLLLNQKSSIIYDKIKQLDVDCNISKYSNWNIRILWYQLCIRVKYYDVLDDLFKFLEINGCTKFVKLLYAEFKSSWPNMMLKAEKFFQEHERIESSMQMKILIDLLDSIREISQSFNIRKKRSKYAQVVESLKESITHLIKQIKNSEITMVEIRKQYISIIENMNIEIDRLGQVVEGQQNPQMKRDFESIKLNFQVEKDKQSILKTSKPHVGEIYKIRVGLESRLEEFLSTMSETNSSSSSSTSASTSLSSRKQKGQSQGRRRPCLIWNTENEGIEVLPIASFGGKDLAKIKTDIQCTISSKDFFNYVLSIHPIASPPNKRSLRPKIIKSMSKPLTGYLILMPIVISDSTPLHGPMPVVFEKNDMLYINNKLDALIKEKQDKIIENIDYSKIIANTQYDDDDSSSQETAHSIPNARSCLFEINHFDKNNLIENWLSKYDDDIKMHNEWQYIDDLAYKDSIEWNPENDDQLNEASVDLYLYPVLHITNLLPIDIQCLFDSVEQVDLKPSQLNEIAFGDKYSTLIFMIPSYHKIKWISESIDLKVEQNYHYNERFIIFHDSTSSHSKQTLNMILRVDTLHESYSLFLYSPFWIINRTELQLELQIENNRTFIEMTETPLLFCLENFESEPNKKTQGQLRLYDIDNENNTTIWSEKFSLDITKSTSMASCKVPNDRVYMICVDVLISSFGLTKIITFSPSIAIINKSTVELEVVETISDKEQDKWKSVNPKEIIPFWSHNIKDGIMCDHYKHSRAASSSFMMNEKYRTLLRMNDKERPVIYVRVSAANFDGLRVIFGDYKIDDAPLLVINCLKNDSVSFSPINNVRTKILPPQNYVYHAWLDSSKSKELVISCGLKKTKLELTSQCGFLGKNDDCNLSYTICVVGTQTILLVTDDSEIIEAASAMSSLAQSGQPAQIVFHDNGLSLVNSITEEEMLYISLNKSKVIRAKTRTCFLRPYIAHEVMGFSILNILQERKYAKSDTYIAHITCSENPPSWLMATSKRLLFGTKISLFDLYKN
ncbi:unnamed protein product [Rotaria socialis]|uniref:Peptidase M1 leukotriene A4 hydrolase/aminopeptidase C-terminal domain-containing protein n=1 Tax=Rotaria socialis TaxID=392032 RepID=A0A820ZFS4_9BILA|nr:unnamed protein product [Rotaria socialis]